MGLFGAFGYSGCLVTKIIKMFVKSYLFDFFFWGGGLELTLKVSLGPWPLGGPKEQVMSKIG